MGRKESRLCSGLGVFRKATKERAKRTRSRFMGRRRARTWQFIRHRRLPASNAEHKHKPSAAELGLSLRQASDSRLSGWLRGGGGGGYMYHNGW